MSQGLMRSAAAVSTCTAISRILGLLRDILTASIFGTSLIQSAFVVAFTAPNLFRRLFGEGALSAAFIPVFTDRMHSESREAALRFSARVMTLLALFLSGIVLVGVGCALTGVHFASPGSKADLVLRLFAIMFPYMLFICTSALCMGILNSLGRFALPAAVPIVLNVVWIACLCLVGFSADLDDEAKIRAVAWAVLIAGVLQCATQLPSLYRLGWRPSFEARFGDPDIRRVLLLMGPAALGLGVMQLNLVVDRLLAYFISDWAAAALYYAERMVYLPLGVFATAMSTVLLPTFSHQAAKDERASIPRTLSRSLRALLLIMIPASAGLIILATPILQLLFEHTGGAFDAESSQRCARALMMLAPRPLHFQSQQSARPGILCASRYTHPRPHKSLDHRPQPGTQHWLHFNVASRVETRWPRMRHRPL